MSSLWQAPLSAFADALASRRPSPAGVAAAAVSAALGVGLLIKVLEITGRRPDLRDRARALEADLRTAADDDAAIVRRLLEDREAGAMKEAIEIPLRAARLAMQARELCAQLAPELSGHLAADLATGAALLEGSLRGILACVEANLGLAPDASASAEARQLRERARMEPQA